MKAMLLLALVLVALGSNACAYEVTVGNRKIWTYPHKPVATIGSLAELRARYQLVKGMLPPTPFVMEDKWVLTDARGNLRVVPRDPEWLETLSPEGKWVLQRKLTDPEFTATPGTARLRSASGKMRWTKEQNISLPTVTDDGIVIFFDRYPSRTAVTFLSKDGKEPHRVTEVFAREHDYGQGRPPLLMPSHKTVIVGGKDEVVAMSLDGKIRWRYRVPAPADRLSRFFPDPAGRGLAVVLTYPNPPNSSVHFLDEDTGVMRAGLWTNEPHNTPTLFSPHGNYGAGVASTYLILTDWLTGREMWRQVRGEAGAPADFLVAEGDASSLSDTGLVAAPLRDGTTVLQPSGEPLWRCTIDPDGYAKNVLSADGKRLVVGCMTTSRPLVLEALLIYALDQR